MKSKIITSVPGMTLNCLPLQSERLDVAKGL
nr:MAG TPA: hypothetical protein [Caudoviricetes sp.]